MTSSIPLMYEDSSDARKSNVDDNGLEHHALYGRACSGMPTDDTA
jgi:hypothetical protein